VIKIQIGRPIYTYHQNLILHVFLGQKRWWTIRPWAINQRYYEKNENQNV